MKDWPTNNSTREAQFAGQFYPGNKGELTNQLTEFFTQSKNLSATRTRNKNLQALIVPHAGYIFSGQVAASAYHLIPENAVYKRVFVLASSHRYSFNGAAVYCHGNYKTLLGEVKVDTKLCK